MPRSEKNGFRHGLYRIGKGSKLYVQFAGCKRLVRPKNGFRLAIPFQRRTAAGYSLQPEISVTTNGETVVGAWNEDGITFEFASGTYVFDYDAEEATPYDYDVTVPADFVTFAGQNDGVFFEITYKKIYSLVFISNFNGNDFFTVVVAAGEKFASVKPDGFEAWKNELIAKRYGFDFRGFYPVSKAGRRFRLRKVV